MAKKSTALPKTETLLVEVLTEELPPKALDALGRSFRDHLTNDLEQAGLRTSESAARYFATPRRLAVSSNTLRAPMRSRRACRAVCVVCETSARDACLNRPGFSGELRV